MSACSLASCKNSDSVPSLSCSGVCGKTFHPKCVGIQGPFADKISNTIGVCWYCTDCRKISLGSLSLRLLKLGAEFSKLQKNFDILHSSFVDVNKNFKELKDFEVISQSTPMSNVPILSSEDSRVTRSKNKGTGTKKRAVNTNNAAPNGQVEIQSDLIFLNSPNPTTDKSKSNFPDLSVSRVDNMRQLVPPKVVVSNSNHSTNLRRPVPLQTIPKQRFVFVSRLLPSTEACDILHHIEDKIKIGPITSQVSVNKIASNRCSSFKISAADDCFDKLLDPNNWPPGSLVKEFVNRNRRDKLNTNQKNSGVSLSSTKT